MKWSTIGSDRRRRLTRSTPHFSVTVLLPLALAISGCGGGGGSSDPSGGSGSVQGLIDTRQIAPGIASAPQNLMVTVDGTSIAAPVQSDGSFQIPSLPAGDYVVVVRNGGPAGHSTIAGHASVHIVGGRITPAEVTLLPAGFIAGVVSKQSASGQPEVVSGVVVTLSPGSPDTPPVPVYVPGIPPPPATAAGGGINQAVPPIPTSGQAPLTLHATSAADGSFTFAGVPPGLYQASAVSGNLTATTFVSVAPAAASTANLFLQATPVETHIEVHGTVSGKDTTGALHPLSGAFVRMAYALTCGPGGPILGGPGGGGIGMAGSGSTTPGSTANRGRQATSSPICVGPPIEPPVMLAGGTAASPPPGLSGPGGPADIMVPLGVKTDEQGNYTLIVPGNVDAVIASADGYLPETQPLTGPASASMEMDFSLDPAPVQPNLKANMEIEGPAASPPNVTAGAPSTVKMSVTNNTSSPVTLNTFGAGADLRLVDASGNLAWSLGFGELPPVADLARVLQPGETVTAEQIVPGTGNNGVALAPGVYVLSGALDGVPANPLKIMVQAPTV